MPRTRLIPFTLTLGALLTTQAFAADLLTVYRDAKQYDATYSAAQYARDAGSEKSEQGTALLLPTVSLAANYTRVNSEYTPGVSNPLLGVSAYDKTGNTYGYTLTAAQPLYRAEVFAGSSQLKEQGKLAEVQYKASEQDLILRVSQAYFDVLLAQDKLELVRAQKEATSQALAQAKKSFEVGVATITDTHEAQARFDGIVAAEIAAENDLVVKKNALRLVSGSDPDTLTPLNPDMKATPPDPDDLQTWLTRAEQSSLAVAAKQSELAIATREIDKYKVTDTPTLDLVATYGDKWDKPELSKVGGTDKTKTATVGLQLNVPLYTGGSKSSKLRESIANQEKTRNELEATRRNASQLTKQAYLGVKAGAAQIKALEQALVSSQSSLDSTKLGKSVGVRTTLDVLNSQQQYYSTRKDLADARYTYLLNRLRLSAAVGELAESQLETVNAQLK